MTQVSEQPRRRVIVLVPTSFQQVRGHPCIIVIFQPVIATELFVHPPNPLPPLAFRVGLLRTRRGTLHPSLEEMGFIVYRLPSVLDDFERGCIPVRQIKVR